MFAFSRLDVPAFIEVDNLARDLNGVARGIEATNSTDTADSLCCRAPESFPSNTVRTDDSDPGYNDARLHRPNRSITVRSGRDKVSPDRVFRRWCH